MIRSDFSSLASTRCVPTRDNDAVGCYRHPVESNVDVVCLGQRLTDQRFQPVGGRRDTEVCVCVRVSESVTRTELAIVSTPGLFDRVRKVQQTKSSEESNASQ
jgi:hypothetical protein